MTSMVLARQDAMGPARQARVPQDHTWLGFAVAGSLLQKSGYPEIIPAPTYLESRPGAFF